MFRSIFQNSSYEIFALLGIMFAFFVTAGALKFLKDKLPKDEGRLFAHNGALSKGKPRGAGIIFIIVFAVTTLLFVPINPEYLIYVALVVAAMLTGYLDDASAVPWGPLKKGLLDFAIALVASITYVNFNGTDINILFLKNSISFNIPVVLFVILSVILIWVSINVTNCSDGVDGLSGSLSVITLLSFYFVVKNVDFVFAPIILIMVFVVLAYLWFNATPSILMMGDAGSRALGLFIAIVALKTQNPFLYIPFAFMLIVDGGAGLIKLSMGRFLKIKVMKNIRTPIHDHYRKNKEWSNTHVVFRFCIVQVIVSSVFIYLLK